MNCIPAFAAFASNTCSMVTSHVAGKIQSAAIDPLIAIGADSFVDKIMPKYEFIDRQDAARKIVKVKRKQALGVSAGDQPDFLDNITSLFHKQTIEEQQFQEEISEQQRSDNQLIKQMDADNRAIDIVVNQQRQEMQIRDRQQLQIIEQKLPKFETNPLTGNQIISQNIIDSVFGANYNQHATVGPIEIAQQNVEMNWQNINQMQIIYENQRNQRSIIDPFGRVLYDNSKLDNRRMLAIAADKVIDLSRNYEEWQKEHPYIDKILLPILPATTGAILGGITGGMTGGPLGILPGIGIGAVAATVSTIKSQLVSLAVGQLGGEEAKRFIMEKGTESFKALDPTLTNDQAHALAAAVLISMTSGAQLKQVIKSTASLGGAFKQDKASMGMNFFASKGEIKGKGLNEVLTAKEIVIKNPYITKKYAKEVENLTRTGRINEKQVPLLRETLQQKEFKKLGKSESELHRKKFEGVKNKLRTEWEQQTGKKWPMYEEDVMIKGKNAKGTALDVHHIIPVSHGGPNEWWNVHPAHALEEHPKIHGTGSTFRQMFYSKEKK